MTNYNLNQFNFNITCAVVTELWVLAAKWELEENLSMEHARMLLQRGLRFNTKSQHLWQEVIVYFYIYYVLSLVYISTINNLI